MSKLKKAIEPILRGFSGKVSYEIREVSGGVLADQDRDSVFPTASTIKIFILGALLEMVEKGSLSLSDEIVMRAEDMVGGTGILKEFTGGSSFAIKDVAMVMIITSDNTATNMLVDLVGGVDRVNEHIRKYGLQETKLVNKADFEAIGTDVRNFAIGTVKEFNDYLALMLDQQVVGKELTEVFVDIMSRQQDLAMFPRFIPYNPYAKDLNLEQDVQVANKTGSFPGVRCDVGYLFLPKGEVIFSVFSKDSRDSSFGYNNESEIMLGQVGEEVYKHIMARE